MVDVNTPQDNILYLSTALVIMDGEGSPEGVVNAALGSLYCDKLTGDFYKKGSAVGTLTGWTSFGGGGGGSIGGSIAATQVAVGSGANTIAGYASLIYDEPNALFYLTQSINAAASLASINTNAGTSAIAQVTANANSVQSTLFATSSGYTPVGLFGANYSVLNLASTTAALIRAGSGAPLIFGIGSTEYARLTTTRYGVLSLGLGASSSSLDVLLERDAANTLALRNGTNAQTLRVYNTTDAGTTNYERLLVGWSSNRAKLLIENGGTGIGRNFDIGIVGNGSVAFITNNITRGYFDPNGNFVFATDNAYDIGASGATRPRNVYVGTDVVVGNDVTASGNILSGTSSFLGWSSRSLMISPSDGVIRLTNNANTDFTRLQFGGTTNSFPAIGRSNASLVISLADGTLATNILPINTNQLQFGGADTASPGAISLRVQNVAAGTSDTNGQNLSIFGSAGTGNAVGGAILLRVAPAGSSGTSQNATIVGLAIDGTGRIYGSALHNNAAGMSGAVNQYIGSGTYSPTITAVANCTVTSPGVNFKYLRVGNVVHVTGQLSIDPTTASTLTRARIALPIASNLTGSVGCQGVGHCADVFGLGGAIFPDTTNDEAELNFICESGTPANNVWCVSFSYEVA